MSRVRRLLRSAGLTAGVLFLASAHLAWGADPGRWVETGYDPVPLEYFQGVTSDPQRNLFFDGLFVGLYRTDSELVEQGRNNSAIPTEVNQRERYNHIGDITWDRREGGRILLPLECYLPIIGNFCRTGSIGVADPATLQWRYYVKLDPAFIDKVMWAETSPDGKLLWTSNGAINGGKDLLAYDMDEITAANAAPDGPLLRPVRVVPNAVPPSGITGAVFYKGRLLLAGQGGGPFRVWSVDLDDGSRRLEIEKTIVGESEGLDFVKVRGGRLHWLITPLLGGGTPTYGSTSALVHFNPVKQPKVKCGDVITKSVKLDADVVCPDGTPAAVTIAASGVTLDLAGHSIVNGRTDGGETLAVKSAGSVTDLEIRNGSIRAGDKAIEIQASDSELERLTVNGRVLALGMTGDGNEIERSTFRDCGSSGLRIRGDGVDVERNTLVGCPLFVVGTGSEIERNDVTNTADAGIAVSDTKARVSRNYAANNAGTGIELFEPGARIARNTANDNGEWGINGVLGTIDGGRNRASGNAEPGQCLNVICGH